MRQEHRVVLLLTLSQTLFQTGGVLFSTIGGLAGLMLAPSGFLATLPVAMVTVGMALAIIPASLLMGRIGRKPGFMLGATIGAIGASLAVTAMILKSFPLLCAGTLTVGFYHGFAQFYRFAAAEASSPAFKSRALSLVLTGGVVAAVLGPKLGALAQSLVPAGLYAGSYLVVVGLSLVAIAVLAVIPFAPTVHGEAAGGPARPLTEIAQQPAFRVAVGGAVIGYFTMVLVMTATPISMHMHHHPVGDAATVIQWHVLGMYVPSFFTGWLIKKMGVLKLMLTGVVALLAHVTIALSGFALLYYVSALTLLGIGWNFLYVGGSTLLTETYRPAERAKVQAFNDFTVLGVTATAALSAGALNEAVGWQGLNLAVIPLLVVAGAGVATLMRIRLRAPQAAETA